MTIDRPDPARINTLLSRYAPTRLEAATGHLQEGDHRALRRLRACAPWIDRIYWHQRSADGWALKEELAGSRVRQTRELQRLLQLNFGPWDTLDDDRPFWGASPRPPGGHLYPADLSREELERYLAQHPGERAALLGHTTLVRRQQGRLVAVPYADAYKEDLGHVAHALREASALATHPAFRTFLRARANDLVAGSLRESDGLWIEAGDSPIDIAVGPYEVYDDALMGVKTSYEATIMVRHPMTRGLAAFLAVAPELERQLPGSVAPAAHRRKLAVGIYDVVLTAGMANMGGKAVAATLPNDERVRSEVGARLLLFRNVIAAKVGPILRPLGARLLRPDQIDLVREEAFVDHTLLHELAHGLASGFVARDGTSTTTTVNDALAARYATIEECRADLVGMVLVDLLVRRGVLPTSLSPQAAVTFVVSSVRSLRFGAGDAYAVGAAIAMSHLLRTGAVKPEAGGSLSVDVEAVHREVATLARTVQEVAGRGDYDGAGRLIEDLGSMPPEIAGLLDRFADIPVDLEFVFDDSP